MLSPAKWHGDSLQDDQLGNGLTMELFIIWFVISIAIGVWAGNKGRTGFGWFLFALFLSPLVAGIFLAVSRDLSAPSVVANGVAPSYATHVKCPDCAELVLREARVCKHCGCKLIPTPADQTSEGPTWPLTPSRVAGIVLALIIVYSALKGS